MYQVLLIIPPYFGRFFSVSSWVNARFCLLCMISVRKYQNLGRACSWKIWCHSILMEITEIAMVNNWLFWILTHEVVGTILDCGFSWSKSLIASTSDLNPPWMKSWFGISSSSFDKRAKLKRLIGFEKRWEKNSFVSLN